jgi:hypothetical protein
MHTYLLLAYEVCSIPEQAAHYHTLAPKLGDTSALGWDFNRGSLVFIDS